MTRKEIQTMVDSDLLDGRTMDDTLFGILINLAKDKIEGARPWVKLRNEDSTQTISPSTTWQTSLTLPTRFAQPFPVKRTDGEYTALVAVNGTEVVPLTELQWPQRLERQDQWGYFAVDYANGTFIVTGTPPKSYTLYWSIIKYSASLDADADTWVFPSQYHAVLAYLVAAMEKSRDYDSVNMANIQLYYPEAAGIISALNLWDSQLQRAMIGV